MAIACIAIGTTTHGKWSYKTVVRYVARPRKDGILTWHKDAVLAQATTQNKITRLAQEYATQEGIPLFPGVRHGQVVAPHLVAGVSQ